MARTGQTSESVKMALDTLRTNKLRSGLTILGIVIGVATVIAISSVDQRASIIVSSSLINSLGSNVFWVCRLPIIGVRPTAEMLARKKLTIDDAKAMRALPHVVTTDAEADLRQELSRSATSSAEVRTATRSPAPSWRVIRPK